MPPPSHSARGDERRECTGQQTGIVGRSASRTASSASPSAPRRSPSEAPAYARHAWIEPTIGEGNTVLSERLRQDIRRPAFVAQDDEGRVRSAAGLRHARRRAERRPPPTRRGRGPARGRRRGADPARPRCGSGGRRRRDRWCEPFGQLAELGSGRRRSAGARLLGRVFERGRSGVIGAVGRERQVPSALLPVAHHLAQATVDR